MNKFFILHIALQDTDSLNRNSLSLLVYLNGIHDSTLDFTTRLATSVFVHTNDQLLFELTSTRKLLGSYKVRVSDIQQLKWVSFQNTMVLLKMDLATLQDNYASSSHKKKARIQSSTPQRSSDKKDVLSLDELLQTIVLEIKKQQLLVQQRQLDESKVSAIRKLLVETQSILELILKHQDHWCRHCVEVHLYDPIARFHEIQK